ncbi:acyl-[acyl-carrier-protein] thioesterase [Flavobacterium wongokense]|uniref:acyl-[acyl-carrier-protein] thioesterase n=1 Tax=Flavobacterium wongokense TaxID=2910674 RepID=UPI001F1B0DC6|nr:acyl-ACP thioesterase domain-containing protein [Flavobacterium sp. WG47]MCF6132084.1 thioesterase [Flavobacterium sp. WG47]
MPISKDFTSTLFKDWEITFLQCYPNGYLKYTDLCNILQLTAGVHAEMGGISFSDMQVHDQAWVLSRMRVEIKRLPKWRDIVTVKTWINSLENSRSIRCLELYIGDEKIVGCETFWAVFNTKTRRPEPLALAHEHFEKYPNDKATEIQFSKIDTTIDKMFVTEKKILLSDLDIVNHANSVKYLEWCLDYTEPKLLLNRALQSFEMNYLKEVSLDETVSIEKGSNQNPTIFTVSSEGKICFALQLNF